MKSNQRQAKASWASCFALAWHRMDGMLHPSEAKGLSLPARIHSHALHVIPFRTHRRQPNPLPGLAPFGFGSAQIKVGPGLGACLRPGFAHSVHTHTRWAKHSHRCLRRDSISPFIAYIGFHGIATRGNSRAPTLHSQTLREPRPSRHPR
jgi:hypothetical protein